jgi:hypothetical protein
VGEAKSKTSSPSDGLPRIRLLGPLLSCSFCVRGASCRWAGRAWRAGAHLQAPIHNFEIQTSHH